MALPSTASQNFTLLAHQYRDADIEFPVLKGITLAQWALESGWGRARLAELHGNYAGMKWGRVDEDFGDPAYLGTTRYTRFYDPTSFIYAYWNRLDCVPVFTGWRLRAEDPAAFLSFITPPWLNGRRASLQLTADEAQYVRDVTTIFRNRTEELFT